MNILLIKLGALGDVLRTTPLLEGLHKKFPGSKITWVVDESNRPVLEGNPRIARLFSLDNNPSPEWAKPLYDLAVNLDKEPEALDALGLAKASLKVGFGWSKDKRLAAVNPESDYAYRLGIDDDLKFRQNRKTYQTISFEQLSLKFENEEYSFAPDETSVQKAKSSLQSIGFDPGRKTKKIIGLNTGSGHRFAGKRLPEKTIAELAETLHQRFDADIWLLGGEAEKERNASISRICRVPVLNTGSHSISVFAGIVALCDLVVTGDTTAMHVAIAVRTPVLAYFASTCAPEIELYGRGEKIISALPCAPCYKKICPIDEQCMKEMTVEPFLKAAERIFLTHGAALS